MYYLAGPMTGLPDYNFPAFMEMAQVLREKGFIIFNPAESIPDKSLAWTVYMRHNIRALMNCQGIFLLPGWERSKGSQLEKHIAVQLEMEIYFL